MFVRVGDHSDLSRLQIWKCILGWAILESMLDVPSQELTSLIQNVGMSTQPALHGIPSLFIHLCICFCILFLTCLQYATYNIFILRYPFSMT